MWLLEYTAGRLTKPSNSAWRPIADTVEDWPLAVCDGGSLPDSDLICCDQVRRKYTGETLYGLSDPAHEWYYLSHQAPNEVLLMKMFDSSDDVRAKSECQYVIQIWSSADLEGCPHASFKHPKCDPSAPHRRSVEVRALVFNAERAVP